MGQLWDRQDVYRTVIGRVGRFYYLFYFYKKVLLFYGTVMGRLWDRQDGYGTVIGRVGRLKLLTIVFYGTVNILWDGYGTVRTVIGRL